MRSIVNHINHCGGRFVDVDDNTGRYYVVSMDRARKKTSQALRETKELKWLELAPRERKTPNTKDCVCPHCGLTGHKTKIAKACLRHHEWVTENSNNTGAVDVSDSPANGLPEQSTMEVGPANGMSCDSKVLTKLSGSGPTSFDGHDQTNGDARVSV